jgi:photosystem II stability/assembly factor-like uncharacterized protein
MAVATDQLQLFLLTADGLVRCRTDRRAEHVEMLNRAIDGEVLREVRQDPLKPSRLYAASNTELHQSEDGGETWQWVPSGGIDFRDIWTMVVHPTRPNEVYVGTLPAAVYVSENGGRSFRELTAFRQLPDYNRWTFPPPPHTAHIRCLVLDARAPDEIIAGVEEGGVVRSRDRGETWEDISGPPSPTAFPEFSDPAGIQPYQMGEREEGRVYRDVHWVVRHPTELDVLYASTGLGSYRTDDGGKTWRFLDYGMGRAYAIPMAAHAGAPDRLFIGAAENGPTSWKGYRTTRAGPYNTIRFSRDTSEKLGGARARVLRSDDRGQTWRYLEGGLPIGIQHMICGVEINPRDADNVFVCFTDGSVYVTHDAGESWRQLDVSQPRLYGVRVFPSI